ncbi:MAG: hypothetical protein SRB1_01933 [Desulfobacteraceae bacterium Eth-SRB1]|nr:MAG: hypothetical protein SRB1_01933 [Desulfobacteraceae bacterium Eth-SRB1]
MDIYFNKLPAMFSVELTQRLDKRGRFEIGSNCINWLNAKQEAMTL